jgi:hypothetical protein
MARVRKRDKWKLMLDEVEEKHRQLEATVAALEEERVNYRAAAMTRVARAIVALQLIRVRHRAGAAH